MLSVIMLCVIMMGANMLNVPECSIFIVMLNGVQQSVVILSVIIVLLY